MLFHDAELIDLALANRGIVSRQRMRAVGITRHVERRLVRQRIVQQVTSSVFSLGSGSLDWDQKLRVALAHAGPAAVLSHASACSLWKLPRIGSGAVEVTVPRGTHLPSRPYGRAHRSRDLSAEESTSVEQLPVTGPGRTLFDMATRLGPVLLDECLQDLARRDLVTVEGMAADLDARRRCGLPGVARMERLLAAVSPLPEVDSWLEARFIRLLADHGLALPETQVWIEVDGHRYRVDALWRPERLIVELKGYATHATRRELSADAEREARLSSLGYEVISFTHDQVVGDSRFIVAQVGRRVVHRRAG